MGVPYIDYEYYAGNGGIVNSTQFTAFEKKAERYLDAFTQNRVKSLSVIPVEVKDLMCEYIDLLAQNREFNFLGSYSNGVESFSFNDNESLQKSLYDLAVFYLPIELITATIDKKSDLRCCL